jgi:hypothetical protein
LSGALTPIKLVYVNARAALFDLYGDHLRIRAGRAFARDAPDDRVLATRSRLVHGSSPPDRNPDKGVH